MTKCSAVKDRNSCVGNFQRSFCWAWMIFTLLSSPFPASHRLLRLLNPFTGFGNWNSLVLSESGASHCTARPLSSVQQFWVLLVVSATSSPKTNLDYYYLIMQILVSSIPMNHQFQSISQEDKNDYVSWFISLEKIWTDQIGKKKGLEIVCCCIL